MEANKLKKLSNEELVEEFDYAISNLMNYANSSRTIKDSTLEKAQRRYDNSKVELLRRLEGKDNG